MLLLCDDGDVDNGLMFIAVDLMKLDTNVVIRNAKIDMLIPL